MLPDYADPAFAAALILFYGLTALLLMLFGTLLIVIGRALHRHRQLNHIEAIRQGMLRHAAADDHHHRARMGLTQGD
ncbi:MAG: hypothetical protein JSR13_11595 [Proteobacteria bacterium]|nr:hypothetical protein [Pseudomonadota bacterium]